MEQPKRQRCTKRITNKVRNDENKEPDACAEDVDMIYTTTVARCWNTQSISLDKEQTVIDDCSREPVSASDSKVLVVNHCRTVTEVSGVSHLLDKCNVPDNKAGFSKSQELQKLREPTPPSTPEFRISDVLPKRARMNRSVEKAIRKLERVHSTIVMDKDAKCDVSDDECVEILETPDVATSNSANAKNSITIKIRTVKADLVKYTMLRTSTFSEIFKHMSAIEQVQPANINLYLRDRKIKEYETPHSINLGIADIIECYIRSSSSTSFASLHNESPAGKNLIQLYVQFGTKSKISISIGKDDTMGKLMYKFCRQQDLEMSDVVFSCDGERIEPSSTPDSLDLDDGFCIDAVVCSKLD